VNILPHSHNEKESETESRIALSVCAVFAWILGLFVLRQTVSGKESVHEFPLRSWLKPKLRKAQRSNSSGVHKVNYPAAVHAIAGETIWVSCQNAQWLFIRLNHGKHFDKFVSPELLCAFRLRKFLYDLNAFSLDKFS
jgi:hypothetical protein